MIVAFADIFVALAFGAVATVVAAIVIVTAANMRILIIPSQGAS
jgi:hypothetical protein